MAVAVTNTTAGLSGKTLAVLETAQTWTAAQTFSSSIILAATQKLYLDNGGDTYLTEIVANNVRIVAGGSAAASFSVTSQEVFGDFSIQALKKLYFDGGGNTYIHEASADVVELVAGAASAMKWADTGVILGAPTGSFKGAGTLNAVAVYDDDVLLTDWVFDLHYEGQTAHTIPEGGRLYSFAETMVSAEHARRLPWMPTRDTFEQERSLGGMISRLWFGQEQQQIYLAEHNARIAALEAKVGVN